LIDLSVFCWPISLRNCKKRTFACLCAMKTRKSCFHREGLHPTNRTGTILLFSLHEDRRVERRKPFTVWRPRCDVRRAEVGGASRNWNGSVIGVPWLAVGSGASRESAEVSERAVIVLNSEMQDTLPNIPICQTFQGPASLSDSTNFARLYVGLVR
jgi:hypothetical protein